MMRQLAISLFMLVLVGCASTPRTPCLTPLAGLRYCLLPPDALSADAAPRLVSVAGPDIDLHMISQLVSADGKLRLAATTLLGQPLFEIEYSATGLRHLPTDAPVNAIWLIAMLQFANADADAVNLALDGAALQVNGDERILQGKRDVLLRTRQQENVTEIFVPGEQMTIRIEKLAERRQ